jgi:YbgC/YbaW family acyl-CoA thioester hydrolase
MLKNLKENINSKEINTGFLQKFRHSYKGRVHFSEVDSFGVAHNLKYFYWLEWARTDYLRAIGLNINPKTFLSEHPLMTVHAEIDYINPCRFNDVYEVLTRVPYVKKSSLYFENLIRLENGLILVIAGGILVNVNPKTLESVRIGDDVRNLLKSFEGSDIMFIED